MSIAPSGQVSTDDVMTELRRANPSRAYPLSLLDSDVLALVGKSGPPVSLPGDFYGKSATSAGGGSGVGGGGGGGGGSTPSTLAASMYDAETGAAAGGGVQYSASVPISITVTGGQAPYSFAWSKVSGTGTLNASTSPTATVSFTVGKFSQPGDTYTARVQCVVRDALGDVVTGAANATLTLD